MKLKSNDLDLRLGRNPCFNISKNPHPNLGETMNNVITKLQLLQEKQSNHISNPIDAKIWLQFALIEEYFLDLFFGVRSAFKGRFRSILVMICDQSYLNMIAIEFRMQGDHKELANLLQNRLISSRFNR